MRKMSVIMRLIKTTIRIPVVELMIFANERMRNGIIETNMILAMYLVSVSVSTPEPVRLINFLVN